MPLEALVGRMLGHLGGAYAVPLVRIGDELGLYIAMDGAGPLTPAELARCTGCNERLVREWLFAHAATGYLDHHAATGRFCMTPEQAMVFARPDSPVLMLGAFEVIASTVLDQPKVARAFRDGHGRGAGYHGRCACRFSGIERSFRPGYAAHLLQEWLPALDGVEERLRRGGALVADLGCGHGAALILMAEAFPESRFVGLDNHAPSIACARESAAEAGVAGNTAFEVAGAADFALEGCDLIASFDALHDMGDPVGAAHPRGVEAGGYLHARRATRGRPAGGQHEPGRPALLRRIDDDLHARLAGPAGRGRTRSAGGPGATGRGSAGSPP
jgi:SAM-dependent methyltransferase